MARETLSLLTIMRRYTEIRRRTKGAFTYIMFENLTVGEDEILVLDITCECYCFTHKSIEYVIRHEDEFKWIPLSK